MTRPTRSPAMADYWRAQDAAADYKAFPSYMIGVLASLVDEATWERALELAMECDRELPRRRWVESMPS